MEPTMSFDPNIEHRLAEDIKTVIKYANEGMHPDDAVTKVAEEQDYNPDLIKTVCGVFNKSKAASYLEKVSTDKRAANFSIADPYNVIRNIYGQEKAATSTATLPEGNFSEIDMEDPVEKTAEATGTGQGQGEKPQGTGGTSYCYCPECGYTEEHSRGTPCNDRKCPKCGVALSGVPEKEASQLSFDSIKVKMEKYAGLYKRTVSEYDTKIKTHTQKVHDCVEKIADHIKRQPPEKMRKIAQLTVNGYPSFGQKMLDLIQSRMTQTIPKVEKTAYAAVFPSGEPYLTMTELCDHAYKLRDLKLAKQDFEKHAGVDDAVGKFLRWVTDNTVPTGDSVPGEPAYLRGARGVGNYIRPGVEAATVGHYSNPAVGRLKQFLGPDVENTLKEIDAKKNFILLSLYDKHLNKYDMSSLAEAYNDAVSANPDLYNNPAVLKPTMLRYLEQGGYVDVPQRMQEIQMGEVAGKAKRLAEADVNKRRQKMETEIDTKYPKKTVDKMEDSSKSSINKRIERSVKGNNASKHIKSARKALKEGDADLARRYLEVVKTKYPETYAGKGVRDLLIGIDNTKKNEEAAKRDTVEDKKVYMSALSRAVSGGKIDKANDIIDEIHEKYPEMQDTPEFRELDRDLAEKERGADLTVEEQAELAEKRRVRQEEAEMWESKEKLKKSLERLKRFTSGEYDEKTDNST